MPVYKIVTYDVWGNDESGYEVNAAYSTGCTIKVETDASDRVILKALQDIGYLLDIKASDLVIEGEDWGESENYSLYLMDESNGKPLLELRHEI